MSTTTPTGSTTTTPGARLDQMARELRDKLAAMHDDGPNTFADLVDQAEERAEREHQVRERARLDARLRDVDAARERVADGSWGRCVVCGQPIQSGRLEVLPMAATCIDHAT